MLPGTIGLIVACIVAAIAITVIVVTVVSVNCRQKKVLGSDDVEGDMQQAEQMTDNEDDTVSV